MRRALGLLALLAALAAAPRAAAAQDPRLAARLDAPTRAAVEAVVDSARAERLPAEPLVQKALEGASRGAQPEVIVRAVRGLAERLRAARAALGERSTEAELVAGAGAVYAGVPAAELARLRRAHPGASAAPPLVALADIVERGVPPETAVQVIRSLAAARVPASAYAALRQAVAQDIRAGASPAAAARTRMEGILLSAGRHEGRHPPL